MASSSPSASGRTNVKQLPRVVVRFAGDSGDGIQVLGGLFSTETAMAGADLATLPNFPAEIRAPVGTTYGVSSYQIQFGSTEIFTPGDRVDTLVAFNPAALKTNVADLKPGGILIVNTDSIEKKNLEKAGYASNPLEDEKLGWRQKYRVIEVDISTQVGRALEGVDISFKEKERAKNFWALGFVSWLYNRPIEPTVNFIAKKFGKKSAEIADANVKALKAGNFFGDTIEQFHETYDILPAKHEPGTYRDITGNIALVYGLLAATQKSGKPLTYCSYPITPASDILHELARHKNFRVRTLQMEDEIAAIGAAIGASYAGTIGVTGTSGPGIALKSEAIGLAVIAELPLVVIDVQRGGPSTGLPTKTEQADLLQVLFGRNGESPAIVIAASTPADAYEVAFEAVRIAVKYMAPVILLSDGYIANGSEPWRIPDPAKLPEIKIEHPKGANGDGKFLPYQRDPQTLARVWGIPGTAGVEHRIGGLEKQDVTGNINYEPDNHEHMTKQRAEKVKRVQQEIPPSQVFGDPQGGVLVVGWGSTFGSIRAAVAAKREAGLPVSHLHIRFLNPLPADLGEIFKRYDKVLVPEINSGQLRLLLRANYLVDAVGFNRVRGFPLLQEEIEHAIDQLLVAK